MTPRLEAATISEAPLVAVVTAVYNGATFLAETMDSVQAQTYPNLVHIVQDNASTDATAQIIARYAHARKPVLVARNRALIPIGQNWNAAVARVPKEARYIRTLCADDVMAPQFVERTVALAQANPDVGVVACRLTHRGADDRGEGWEPERTVYPGREVIRRFLTNEAKFIAHQTLIRRALIAQRSPMFDESLIAFDTDACLDILQRSDFGFVHANLATTRDHPGTYTRAAAAQLMVPLREQLVLLERYAKAGLGDAPGAVRIRLYRRAYFRKVLRWRRHAPDAFRAHVSALRADGRRPLLLQFADSVLDWPLAKLRLRSAWTGYPF